MKTSKLRREATDHDKNFFSLFNVKQIKTGHTIFNKIAVWSEYALSPEDALDPWLPTECPVKTDQTSWMCSLIRVFAGRICNLIGNAVPQIKILEKTFCWSLLHNRGDVVNTVRVTLMEG